MKDFIIVGGQLFQVHCLDGLHRLCSGSVHDCIPSHTTDTEELQGRLVGNCACECHKPKQVTRFPEGAEL